MKKEYSFMNMFWYGLFIFFLIALVPFGNGHKINIKNVEKDSFRMLISEEYRDIIEENPTIAKEFENVDYEYRNDIDIARAISDGQYDAVWISNSMWMYMSGLTPVESSSIAISPVVFALDDDIANKYNIKGQPVSNKYVLDMIREDDNIHFSISSVARSNTGATAYLNFLSALSGNPEILTLEHIHKDEIQMIMHGLFDKISRNAGSDSYVLSMYDRGDCNMLVATEASIIRHNLTSDRKLYMLYPTDGVGIVDSTLSFIGKSDKKATYDRIRDRLLSEDVQQIMYSNGYRTWYGGTMKDVDGRIFNEDWGVNTQRVINVTSFPSKEIINEALNNYITMFRTEALTVFVLDYSGSMYGEGYKQLTDAMSFILNPQKSSKEFLQFSPKDTIYIVYFTNNKINKEISVYNGENSGDIIEDLYNINPNGRTPLYESLQEAYNLARVFDNSVDSNNCPKSIILMTDGETTGKNFKSFKSWYETQTDVSTIPVFTIAFGDANTEELTEVAELTGGLAFDGRDNLLEAFRAIRGYN